MSDFRNISCGKGLARRPLSDPLDRQLNTHVLILRASYSCSDETLLSGTLNKMDKSFSASSSTLASIPASELDAYIADLIVQKARAKQAQSSDQATGSYLEGSDDDKRTRVPNTNKRFLASVIQNVEGHNRALLRREAREAEAKSNVKGKGNARSTDDAVDTNTRSRLRGWSDEEEEIDGQDDEKDVGLALSSKMDRYFDEPDDAHGSVGKQENARKRPHKEDSPVRSSSRRHKSEEEGARERRHERRRDGEGRRRSEKQGEKATSRDFKDNGHRSRSRRETASSSHSRRDSHRKREQRTGETERQSEKDSRKRERGSAAERKAGDGRSHKGERDRDRSASPKAYSTAQKIREWDLGKDSLAT